MTRILAGCLSLALVAPARAEMGGRIRMSDPDAVAIDWTSGRVEATGVGLADRHAPNPAVARGPARRKGEEAARARLARAIRALPLAAGGTVDDRDDDAGVKRALARAVDTAHVVVAELETDGSWRVTLAVPLEAIRQAVFGVRDLPAGGDLDTTPVVVVKARGAPPGLGYEIGGTPVTTVWSTSVPSWAKRAPVVEGKRAAAGRIDAKTTGFGPATLFVIVSDG